MRTGNDAESVRMRACQGTDNYCSKHHHRSGGTKLNRRRHFVAVGGADVEAADFGKTSAQRIGIGRT